MLILCSLIFGIISCHNKDGVAPDITSYYTVGGGEKMKLDGGVLSIPSTSEGLYAFAFYGSGLTFKTSENVPFEGQGNLIGFNFYNDPKKIPSGEYFHVKNDESYQANGLTEDGSFYGIALFNFDPETEDSDLRVNYESGYIIVTKLGQDTFEVEFTMSMVGVESIRGYFKGTVNVITE